MNRSPKGLERFIDGFIRHKTVEGLAESTVNYYRSHLNLFANFIDYAELDKITPAMVEDFLYWLQTDYKSKRVTGKIQGLSKKSVYNYYVVLQSFFSWAIRRGFLKSSPIVNVPRPKFQENSFKPLTKEEIVALLDACEHTKRADTNGRRSFKMKRKTYRRDLAIIHVLLDTGMRATELCKLTLEDLNEKTGEMHIKKGKGGKGRYVFIGNITKKVLWDYLIERPEGKYLFYNTRGGRLNHGALNQLLRRLGNLAGVRDCHTHRFRHTFAISYLRNGGDLLTLQALLGHSSLEMVKRYAAVAKIDLELTHRRASPVDNLW